MQVMANIPPPWSPQGGGNVPVIPPLPTPLPMSFLAAVFTLRPPYII